MYLSFLEVEVWVCFYFNSVKLTGEYSLTKDQLILQLQMCRVLGMGEIMAVC